MAAQSQSAQLNARLMVHDTVVSVAGHHETDMTARDRSIAPARGIILAVLLSLPFWALFAFTLYKLL